LETQTLKSNANCLAINKTIMSKQDKMPFHGGCYGCMFKNLGTPICGGCQYKDANWNKPNLNTSKTTYKNIAWFFIKTKKNNNYISWWLSWM